MAWFGATCGDLGPAGLRCGAAAGHYGAHQALDADGILVIWPRKTALAAEPVVEPARRGLPKRPARVLTVNTPTSTPSDKEALVARIVERVLQELGHAKDDDE